MPSAFYGSHYFGPSFFGPHYFGTGSGEEPPPPTEIFPPSRFNLIGKFQLGISPIGTIPLFDYWATIISQYANSPILIKLIANFEQYMNPTADMDAFYDLIWNVDTAQGYGLDVWGRIVGVVRTLQVSNADYFGFQEAGGASIQPFNSAPFFSGGATTNNFNLSDNDFRTLIFAKALANISDGSIPALNQLLLNLLPGRGNCYVTDDGDMTMTWTFEFIPTPVEAAILTQSGVLPKPVGVTDSIVFIA